MLRAPSQSSRIPPMPKALTITGMVFAVLVLIIFGLDMAIGVPFNKASFLLDACMVLAAAGLGYMSYNTWRELK